MSQNFFFRQANGLWLISGTETRARYRHFHNWRKYAGGDIGRLFKITRRLELCFWPTRKRSQPSQGDFFALQCEPCKFYWRASLVMKTKVKTSVIFLCLSHNATFFFILEKGRKHNIIIKRSTPKIWNFYLAFLIRKAIQRINYATNWMKTRLMKRSTQCGKPIWLHCSNYWNLLAKIKFH